MLTVQDLTPDELDYWNERSAFFEFDAGMSRAAAEEMAMGSVEARRLRQEYEREKERNDLSR